MSNASNGKFMVEQGQTPFSSRELTDSGDHTLFNDSTARWSKRVFGGNDYSPVILPNGINTPGAVIPAVSETANMVDMASTGLNLNGVVKEGATAISDTDVTLTRDGVDAYQKHSLVIEAAGTVAFVAGSAHASAFSNTRGADGGPPLIGISDVEIAQVHLSATGDVVITTDQIFTVDNVHRERSRFPSYSTNYFRVVDSVELYAGIKFVAALPLIHTGPVVKKIYVSGYTPIMTEVQVLRDVKVPQLSGSLTSVTFYQKTIGDKSTSLTTGGFEYAYDDGITDPVFALENQELFMEFYPDAFKSPYKLLQGFIFFDTDFPAEGVGSAAATITAGKASENVF